MTKSSKELVYEFIELNPRCTRRMLMDATGLMKCTLGKIIRDIKFMLITEIEMVDGKPVEHYTIDPHYDARKVIVKSASEFFQIPKPHPIMAAFYGQI